MDVKFSSTKKLREICQPNIFSSKRNWRDKIYQKFSIYFTKAILHTSIKATQISELMILFGLFAFVFFIEGSYKSILIGLFFYHISLILDWIDGEVMRCRKNPSPRGAYLDYLHHSTITPLIIIGIAIAAYKNNPLEIPKIIFLIAGFIGVYSFLVNGHLKMFDTDLQKEKNNGNEGRSNKIKEEIAYFFKIDWPFNFIFFFGIFNLIHYAVLIYAAFSFLLLLKRISFQIRIFKGEKGLNLR
jgi:phosphatidylglycerophosphate synthase